MKRGAVITGVGIVSSLGCNKEEYFRGLIKGTKGSRKITLFDPNPYTCKIGGEIPGFEIEGLTCIPGSRLTSRVARMAIVSIRQSLSDANLLETIKSERRTGITVGSCNGALGSAKLFFTSIFQDRSNNIDYRTLLESLSNNLAGHIASEFSIRGPQYIFSTACTAGANAVACALDLIRSGECDIVLCGGIDEYSELSHAAFDALGLLNEKCCPFNKNRKGFFLGEGGAFFVMESIEHALRRNAPIQAEVMGYGLSCDAYHITAPDPDAKGLIRAIKNALQDSGIAISEVDYINAHGTGTILNDLTETKAIKEVFGAYAYQIPISSIKPMIGHVLGGGSALEIAACILAIQREIIPPTINFEEIDPSCDLDYVPNTAREAQIRIAISNSFAFGGNNTVVVLKKP